MLSLLEELKRRRVFRVAGIYAVVSWVVAQIASEVFPALLLPEWTITFVVALLILGFPIAMVLAWAFDIGPDGIERTAPRPDGRAAPRGLNALIYGVLLLGAMGGLYAAYTTDWFGLSAPEDTFRNSIAVLPFDNYSATADNDYFSDGMSEELLNLLARVPGLRVASRTSSFAYRGQQKDIRAIGRELGVDTVLEGSVRREGDRVRITAQLIDASNGYHLWVENYDRELKDVFDLQDDIAGEIVKALKVTLGTEEQPEAMVAREAPPTADIRAYDLYLQARSEWKRRGEEAVRRSIELFQQALEIDPDFGRAHAGLAAAYVVYPGYAGEPVDEWRERAATQAQLALAADSSLAEAHAVLAELDSAQWNWSDAEAAFFFATSLDPNDATARHWYSLHLRTTGRLDDSLDQALLAVDLDPASPVIHHNLAQAYMMLGFDEKALDSLRTAQELGFESGNTSVPIMVALRRGDMAGLRTAMTGAGIDERVIEIAATSADDPTRAEALLTELEDSPDGIPMPARFPTYLFASDPDRAIDAAIEAADGTRQIEVSLLWLPEARAVRTHPRFRELAERMGLVDYWKRYGVADECRLLDDDLRCT